MRRKKKQKTFILALDKDDPEKELEFELDFQMSLTARQRYEIMDRLVKDGTELLKRDGHKIAPASLVDHNVKFLVIGAWALPAYGTKG